MMNHRQKMICLLAKEYYEDSLDGLGSAVSKWMSELTVVLNVGSI